MVAHHSWARVEAKLRDLDRILADESPYDPSLPYDALCFCDMTTSPNGELVTVEDRLSEVRRRYGKGLDRSSDRGSGGGGVGCCCPS